VQKNRAAARQIMQELGYGPGERLSIKLATRNDFIYRNPAVILIDQLKEIGIDAELDVIDTTRWFPKVSLYAERQSRAGSVELPLFPSRSRQRDPRPQVGPYSSNPLPSSGESDANLANTRRNGDRQAGKGYRSKAAKTALSPFI